MKYIILATANFVTWSLLVSCFISQGHKALTQESHDPMTEIWREYGAKIDSLATQGTSIHAWRNLPPESETHIRSENDLREILSRYESLSTARIDHDCRLFKKSNRTVCFGLELDFRALIFFDENDQAIEAFVMAN